MPARSVHVDISGMDMNATGSQTTLTASPAGAAALHARGVRTIRGRSARRAPNSSTPPRARVHVDTSGMGMNGTASHTTLVLSHALRASAIEGAEIAVHARPGLSAFLRRSTRGASGSAVDDYLQRCNKILIPTLPRLYLHRLCHLRSLTWLRSLLVPKNTCSHWLPSKLK